MKFTFGSIKKECLSWHDVNRIEVTRFFDALYWGAVYNPTLNMAVLYCKWRSGGELVDRTFEVVFNVTPPRLLEHVLGVGDGWDKWTSDILADFDHYSFSLEDERDVETCIAVLASICTLPDWTTSPQQCVNELWAVNPDAFFDNQTEGDNND